jgi:hypothetical protein
MKYSAHHVLFYRRHWNKGYAHKLRRLFVYEIPDDVHRKLHEVVGPVPTITEHEARELFVAYKRNGDLDLNQALKWLAENAPNDEFKNAILAQLGFLREAFR